MLTHLRIRNFKIWQDTGKIRMAPITLLFGANSSGKSSIGQFLMMLKQTVDSQDRKAVLYTGGRNSAVQLSSYREMVLHRDTDNNVSFEYEWDFKDPLKLRDPVSGHTYSGSSLFFQATVGLGDSDLHNLSVDSLQYRLVEHGSGVLTIGMERRAGTNSEFKVEAEGYSLLRERGRPWSRGAPIKFYGFPDIVMAYYQNANFVQDLNLQHETLFRSVSYLGPLRTKPERLYSWAGIEPESVGYAGENAVAALLAGNGRMMNLGHGQRLRPFQVIIALELQRMGLIDEFKISAISEQRQEYEVKVRTKGSYDWVDLPDVGFGISLVLPVLVQCFYAPQGSIILMEQPEIHLHPSAQSALADVMIDVIKSREDGVGRNVQLIIETHSEHFLRRLQRRIAEGVISEDDVSAYFANTTESPATLDPLKIDEYGSVLNWPDNFFGDEMGDITGQAKAAMQKRMSHSHNGLEVSA